LLELLLLPPVLRPALSALLLNCTSLARSLPRPCRAFEKLADLKLGVAGIEFRRVPCGYRPANPAPDGPSTMPAFETPAALGYSGTPYAPANLQDLYQQKLVQRFDGPGAKQGELSGRQAWRCATQHD
jgi:hypothetical protein